MGDVQDAKDGAREGAGRGHKLDVTWEPRMKGTLTLRHLRAVEESPCSKERNISATTLTTVIMIITA